ncbi:ArsR/SmtB family transcription factor [Ferruginivarius sediminum]|uniref:ArsR family transcriptional regulator n=1 Tax=Ferruginivarius sediminum TaxID=2661937 RepID=A0A369TDN7_9PROT|nr:metalloregulator ArsR/SmtB family transcription factor [Ferruginivarius sediminum]RDD62495.1 ArsR family transcriptional regulator [Ferruginivarius sediminum]
MEMSNAIEALAALAQETRLETFRLLVEAGPNGMPAGEIARELDVQPATLSFHLSQLERAGLLRSRRQSRQIIYAADYEGMRRLMTFLTEKCCHGHPEICGDLPRLANTRCPPAPETQGSDD